MSEKQLDQFSYRAKDLREKATGINAQASYLEALSRGLKKANKGDFLVFETKNNTTMPVKMGIFDGISFRSLDPVVLLKNPAYLLKDTKTGKYNLKNNRTEQNYFAIVVDSIVRNVGGKSTLPKVHRETTKNKREKTAEEVLQKYGCSIEQYKQLYASTTQPVA